MTSMPIVAGGLAVPVLAPGTVQTVSVSGVSTAVANAFGATTRVIRVVATTAIHYAVGSAPTATTSDSYLPADVVEFIHVSPGQKIAFIQNASSGTAYVTEAK